MTYINDIASAGEWARLDHQAGLVGRVTGLLPPLLEDEEFTSILDVGCGPGRWALDIAGDRPEAEVMGIDLSVDMMKYANARARTQHLKNSSFRVQDFLTHKLPFPEGTFDLIHVRFAVGWLKHAGWLLLLNRCFVLLKPGGYLVITEGGGIYTTSAALQSMVDSLLPTIYAGREERGRYIASTSFLPSISALARGTVFRTSLRQTEGVQNYLNWIRRSFPVPSGPL